MDKKQEWETRVESVSEYYLQMKDGGFDENMKAWFVGCDYEEQSLTIGFPTLQWQINERGDIHGGAIAGMFDSGLGLLANFVAGKNEATTTDMNICFLRPLELGQTCEMKVVLVKAGRTLIRLRGELLCKETQKLVATSSGSWMPL